MVITPKMVKKAISNLNSSKASGSDGIPVVVLKNCEPELSFILTDLFNLCLKESCFPDCWKVSSVVPVFKNVGERSDPKNSCPVQGPQRRGCQGSNGPPLFFYQVVFFQENISEELRANKR